MDEHPHPEHDEHIQIGGQNIGNEGEIPRGPDLPHHRLGRVPRRFVGHRRVQIRAGTEEQTGERNEDKGLENAPRTVQPRDVAFRHNQRIKMLHQCAGKNHARPHTANTPQRRRGKVVDDEARRKRNKRSHRPPVVLQAFPELIDKDAQPVQAAPDDEVPACPVPETAQQHRVHVVDVGGNLLPRSGKDKGRCSSADDAPYT